jgi:hypothetical protein
VQSLRKRRDESGLPGSALPFLRLNAKARLLAGPFFYLLYFIELNETKMPVSAGLFFGVQVIDFWLFMGFGVWFLKSLGLDMRVCWDF